MNILITTGKIMTLTLKKYELVLSLRFKLGWVHSSFFFWTMSTFHTELNNWGMLTLSLQTTRVKCRSFDKFRYIISITYLNIVFILMQNRIYVFRFAKTNYMATVTATPLEKSKRNMMLANQDSVKRASLLTPRTNLEVSNIKVLFKWTHWLRS